MSKTFHKLRDFDSENEPKMGDHEGVVWRAINENAPIERDELVKVLNGYKEDGSLVSDQDTSGFLSFHQRSLRLRGLIRVDVEKSETAAAARKETQSIKVLTRIREFDAANEPKMGEAERRVYDLIPKDGIKRPDLVDALAAQITSGEYQTSQMAPGIISFQQNNLRKRGLIKVETVEEKREEETEEKAPAKDKKAAAK